jgi:hypothetical protein
LKHADVSKYIRNLSPASRAILLSGPAGWLSGLENFPDLAWIYDAFKIFRQPVFMIRFFFVEELYQQMLAKALAHFFDAKLLLLDVTDFSLKVSIYGCGCVWI